ncbi:TetR family transcriptional regulator C-terminal domain-containing protein [Kushneria aurantia]|uniref:TetR family transcriptional regulator C-terminal domain-containing protein n=1 Tax=Kushneria aurantia TaxID=504092 RepID=A0ABV6G197_9GAMM|nr:TetR family transcriptional regulator C-terminal domain-containing protein [Kushneria aurantia]
MERKNFQRWSQDERRQSLLEATLACVAEQGLEGATARQIAQRADVTAGLIRHYFGSKEKMVQAAYELLIGELTHAAKCAAEADGGEPQAQLARFVVANVTPPNLSAGKVSLWATFIGRVRTDPGYAAVHRDSYREFLVALEALIHPVLVAHDRKATPACCSRYAIALNALIDGLWLEGSLDHGLYDVGTLPTIALAAAEGILGLPADSLAGAISTTDNRS